MARTIYEKSTRVLLKDMLADMGLRPGQVFTTSRVIDWFQQHYPKLQAGSIRAHLVQASTNDRSRLHHTSTNASDDLLFKVDSGQFRLYEPGKDPAPIHEFIEGDVPESRKSPEQRKMTTPPGHPPDLRNSCLSEIFSVTWRRTLDA